MRPYLLGLTGSIGTGKTTTAQMFHRLKIPVHDADKEVHRLLETDREVQTLLGRLFPECHMEGRIDRVKLGLRVFHDPLALGQLEEILHPRVQAICRGFIAYHRKKETPLAVLDIPLLFEKGYETLCDKVIVTVCDPELQRARVLARPGMVLEKFKKILENQLSPEEKRLRGDYLLETGKGRLATFRQLRDILDQVCHEIQMHESHRP